MVRAKDEKKCPDCGRLIFSKGMSSHRKAHKRGTVVTPDMRAEAQKRWDNGESLTKIARYLGVNEGTLYGLIWTEDR